MPDLEKINEILYDHEKRISGLERHFQKRATKIPKLMSLNEFILSKNPKNDVDKTLTIGYYLENFEGFSSFNVKDLKKGFMQAKESIPSNINDMINCNIRKGMMMEAQQRKDNLKAWVLTNSGEKFVENNLK